MQVTASIKRVAQLLSESEQQRRICKLLTYLCHGVWVAPKQGDRPNLPELIQGTLIRYPTLQQLDQRLNQAVGQLSKPIEYALVAREILSKFQYLYAFADQTSADQAFDQASTDNTSGNTTVAAHASSHSRPVRAIATDQGAAPAERPVSDDTARLVAKPPKAKPATEQTQVFAIRAKPGRANVTPPAASSAPPLQAKQAPPPSDAITQFWQERPGPVRPERDRRLASALQNGSRLTSQATPEHDLAAIITWLKHFPEQIRLKRLLVFACFDVWELQAARLEQVAWPNLLRQIQAKFTAYSVLEVLLHERVSSLNKPELYGQIATAFLDVIRPLFPAECHQTTVPEYAIAAIRAEAGVVDGASSASAELRPQLPDTAVAPTDRFERRLALMRYTNPFMAKVLSFSLLYRSFEYNPQDWLELRNYALDELLDLIPERFPQYQGLERALQQIAKQLPEPDMATQAAGSLLRVLKPAYANGVKSES